MYEKIKEIKYETELYHIYKYVDVELNTSYIVKGRSQDGNDYILKNVKKILKDNMDIEVDSNKLIWMHGDGPSPHFILYKDDNMKINSIELERFIRSNLPKKSNKGKQLTCSLLSDVRLTDTKGLVNVKSKKLNKLL